MDFSVVQKILLWMKNIFQSSYNNLFYRSK